MPDAIAEQLADQQDSDISARMPRTEDLPYERAGGPRPLRPPGHRHALPNRHPSHQRSRLPRPSPGENHQGSGPAHGDARSTRPGTSSQDTPPARPVRGRPWKADGYTDRSGGPDAVRYASVDTATQGSTARQGDTRRDREETARIAENPRLAGRFRWWWQVMDSNHRRRSRRFYSVPLPSVTYAADVRRHRSLAFAAPTVGGG